MVPGSYIQALRLCRFYGSTIILTRIENLNKNSVLKVANNKGITEKGQRKRKKSLPP